MLVDEFATSLIEFLQNLLINLLVELRTFVPGKLSWTVIFGFQEEIMLSRLSVIVDRQHRTKLFRDDLGNAIGVAENVATVGDRIIQKHLTHSKHVLNNK